jgi:hypothetical protein
MAGESLLQTLQKIATAVHRLDSLSADYVCIVDNDVSVTLNSRPTH